MTPACSIDDVDDPEMRKFLCNYMYTTEWRSAEKEATASFKKKTRILSDDRNVTTTDPVSKQDIFTTFSLLNLLYMNVTVKLTNIR